eukprot:CAMPEP_0202692052 /NCGR_PEP_ID=MMETSP1385-20130828/6543_1 /ASSEMBLY_ACC=CAM_ASM_000861 /TAXON_ID=933848 /ORGANISM="Elphidium margaritaceum" /LENGTH=1172 /DNA_ID=CAMNT_0049347525 /DNA_START=87 /DNA_END=3605 /DNA_ORIENTATION=-
MFYSWLTAVLYTLVYTVAVLLTKHKATQRMEDHKRNRSSMQKGLIQHQQDLTPNFTPNDNNNATNNTTSTKPTLSSTTNSNSEATANKKPASENMDLSQLHQRNTTSSPYGAPISNYECGIAVLHSLDAGLHIGLLVEMLLDSQSWNLQEQYLLVCVALLVSYRVISFFTVYISLPRYSYSKHVKRSEEAAVATMLHSGTQIVSSTEEEAAPPPPQNANATTTTTTAEHHDEQESNGQASSPQSTAADNTVQLAAAASMDLYGGGGGSVPQSRSCLSYSWLQLLFDFGYVMELAPWLWNWEYTKIILPEFAWFSKMRTLFQSFPFAILMVVSLLSIDNINQHIHYYFIATLFVSVLTIVLSLTLYDHRTLNIERDTTNSNYSSSSNTILYVCNFCYRVFSTVARIIILAFLLSFLPWYFLFLIVAIPIIAYSGPYALGNSDAEPLNLLFQSLLVFPDYSAPFGKIADSETYLNRINKLHLVLICTLGLPLIVIFILVEKLVHKLVGIDNEVITMNKDKYASFRITTYTLSRFVESAIELIVIAAQLYSPFFASHLLVRDVALVYALFWTAVVFTVLAPIPFMKLYDEFVVDNEEDYELWYGVQSANGNPAAVADGVGGGGGGSGGAGHKPDSDYIVTNAQYNMNHNFSDVGNGLADATSASHNAPHHNQIVSTIQHRDGYLDIRGSRQYLRQKQYWIAVHRNDYKQLRWVLRSRQHVNLLEYNEQEQLGMIIVALRHDWQCVQLLIKHGGGLRHLARYAALHGQLEILRYLYDSLAINVANLTDNADEVLLFSAIEGGQPKVVELLAKYGAQLTAESTEGESAVILAAKNGALDILKVFGEYKVDLKISDDQGNTVAHYAAQIYNGKHIISYLATLYGNNNSDGGGNGNGNDGGGGDGFDFNGKNKRGASAAYLAAWKGQIDNLEVLCSVGADFNIANNDGNNCLIAAAMNDQPMIINYLLDERKMDVDFCNDCQETSVYWAASNGCGCIEQLIAHKANLEKCDKYGITPLMVAAEHGEVKAVELLLQNGASSNHQNQDGETALMKACAEGFLDCVKMLIKHETDHSLRDDEGNPAILWCCMTGNMEIFQFLVVDALKLTKDDIEQTVNNDKETCIDWIVENKLELGLQVLSGLGIDVSKYMDEDDDEHDGSENDDQWDNHYDDDDDDDDDD